MTEFGGLGHPDREDFARCASLPGRAARQPSTTIALVATDAMLDEGQAKRLAISSMAASHAPCVSPTRSTTATRMFAASTGRRPLQDDAAVTEITALAADCVARAIARGVYEATALPYPDALPAWRDRFRGR